MIEHEVGLFGVTANNQPLVRNRKPRSRKLAAFPNKIAEDFAHGRKFTGIAS